MEGLNREQCIKRIGKFYKEYYYADKVYTFTKLTNKFKKGNVDHVPGMLSDKLRESSQELVLYEETISLSISTQSKNAYFLENIWIFRIFFTRFLKMAIAHFFWIMHFLTISNLKGRKQKIAKYLCQKLFRGLKTKAADME